MSEGMQFTLNNPVGAFLSTFAMFLAGIVIGEYWHLPPAMVAVVTVLAAFAAVAHELFCCFVWSSLAGWWIGRRTAALERKR